MKCLSLGPVTRSIRLIGLCLLIHLFTNLVGNMNSLTCLELFPFEFKCLPCLKTSPILFVEIKKMGKVSRVAI